MTSASDFSLSVHGWDESWAVLLPTGTVARNCTLHKALHAQYPRGTGAPDRGYLRGGR